MAKSLWRDSPVRACLAGLLLVASVHAAAGVGGMPDAYLRSPVGATFFSLGGAATADPSYLHAWWNPAALATTKGFRASLGGGIRMLGRADGFGGFEYRATPRLGLGAVLLYRGDPFLRELRDNEGDDLGNGSYTTITWKLGLGYYLSRRLSVGAALSVFYQTLPALSSTGTAWVLSVGGVDAAVRCRILDSLTLSASLRDVGASMEWQFESGGLDQATSGNLPLSVVVGSRLGTRLADRPFSWQCDVKIFALDSKLSPLPHSVAVINNGFEWRRWDGFAIRAGIAEIPLSGDLLRNPRRYGEEFSMSVTAGFAAHLSSIAPGLWLNYGLATNKVRAGVDQQMDLTYVF